MHLLNILHGVMHSNFQPILCTFYHLYLHINLSYIFNLCGDFLHRFFLFSTSVKCQSMWSRQVTYPCLLRWTRNKEKPKTSHYLWWEWKSIFYVKFIKKLTSSMEFFCCYTCTYVPISLSILFNHLFTWSWIVTLLDKTNFLHFLSLLLLHNCQTWVNWS